MKRRLLCLVAGVGIFAATNAQKLDQAPAAPADAPDAPPVKQAVAGKYAAAPAEAKTASAPIWSEDFGNGFPAGWSKTDSSGICPWTWSLDGSWGYFNNFTGTKAADSIRSATAGNGFLIVDNDSANHFTYGQPSGTTYKYLSTYFTTSAIDLTGHPNVILSFSQYFRKNNSVNLNVAISTDSVNWTNYTVQGNVANNAASANPMMAKLNISSVAGNQPKVYIRIGWSARVYFWMIDDMEINDAPANELVLEDHFFNQDTSKFTGFYFYTPKKHTVDIDFAGAVFNEGSSAQTNVTVNANVIFNSGSSVFNASSPAVASFPTLTRDTLEVTNKFMPVNVGTYDLTTTVKQNETDVDTTNNFKKVTFWLTDSVFGRDGNTAGGSVGNSSFSQSVPTDDGFVIGNIYELTAQDTASSISFRITGTKSGTTVIGEIYEFDGSTWVVKAQTDIYDITAQDSINGWITVPFLMDGTSEILDSGGYYIVGVNIFGSAGNVFVRTDVSKKHIPQVTRLYIPATATWYYTTGGIPFIRLNLKRSSGVGIEETASGLKLHSAYPNPAGEMTMLSYTLSRASEQVTVEVYNMIGEKVSVLNEGRKNAGNHQVTVSTGHLPAGTYLIRLNTGNGFATEKVSVTR